MVYDLCLERATLITCDAADRVIEDGAICITGNRLEYVGPRNAMPAAAVAKRTLDLAGRVITPGLVNVHTHAILSMVRGVAEDLGFAPAYTPGIPHGHDVTPEEAWALSRLGALEALLAGSTLINDTYVHADVTSGAMAALGLRVWNCGRIHDADFSLIGEGRWEHHTAIGEKTLGEALALADRWHGKENGRVGVQLAAHAPDTCSDDFLVEIRKAAESRGLRVNTHLAQSRTEIAQIRRRSNKTPAELLEDVGLLNERLTAAHCIFVTDTDITRCGRAGISIAHIQGQRHRRHDRADRQAARRRRAACAGHGQHARRHGRGDALGACNGPRAGRRRQPGLAAERRAACRDHGRRSRHGPRRRNRITGGG